MWSIQEAWQGRNVPMKIGKALAIGKRMISLASMTLCLKYWKKTKMKHRRMVRSSSRMNPMQSQNLLNQMSKTTQSHNLPIAHLGPSNKDQTRKILLLNQIAFQ